VNIKNPDEKNNENRPCQAGIYTIVFFSNSGEDALAVLRVLGPARNSGFKVIWGVENGAVHFERILEGDVVVLQRDFPRDLNSYERIMTLAYEQKKPVVLDLDDLLFDLPEEHPDRTSHYFSEALLPMLQAIMEVDLVTVATHALRERILPFNRNIVVFPNYLNDELWELIEPVPYKPNSDQISIGYMGGHSHKPDILMVSAVLLKLLEKYSYRIKFKFWGIEPPPELAPFAQVDWCPPKSLEYHAFATYFQTQTADIMIAPLMDTAFNACKSAIKYLEYSSIGVPGVYSRLAPYSSVIEDGVDGLLASSPIEWEASLSRLIDDHDLRRRIALNAQRKIKENWLLSQNAFKFKQLYEAASISHKRQENQLPPFHVLVRSVTRQVFEDNQHKNHLIIRHLNTIQTLQDQVAEFKEQTVQLNEKAIQLKEKITQLTESVNEREEEVLSYALSTSWEITRPLRKLSRKLNKGAR